MPSTAIALNNRCAGNTSVEANFDIRRPASSMSNMIANREQDFRNKYNYPP